MIATAIINPLAKSAERESFDEVYNQFEQAIYRNDKYVHFSKCNEWQNPKLTMIQ